MIKYGLIKIIILPFESLSLPSAFSRPARGPWLSNCETHVAPVCHELVCVRLLYEHSYANGHHGQRMHTLLKNGRHNARNNCALLQQIRFATLSCLSNLQTTAKTGMQLQTDDDKNALCFAHVQSYWLHWTCAIYDVQDFCF